MSQEMKVPNNDQGSFTEAAGQLAGKMWTRMVGMNITSRRHCLIDFQPITRFIGVLLYTDQAILSLP